MILYVRDPKTGKRVPIPAIKGEDGKQMFVRFSAYADGTDMSEKWDAARSYMGIAFALSAPTDKADYQWIYIAAVDEMTLLARLEELKERLDSIRIAADDVSGLDAFLESYKAARIATGSYVGVGGNDSHKVSLVLPFSPKAILIHTTTDLNNTAELLFATPPCTNGVYIGVQSNGLAWSTSLTASVEGTTVLLELGDPTGSIQVRNRRYSYVAFG